MKLKPVIVFLFAAFLSGSCNSFRFGSTCSTDTSKVVDSFKVDIKTEPLDVTEKVAGDTVLQNGKVILLNANNYININ